MLFSYIYVPHKMEKMQAFIDFIFYEVWCKARVRGPFCLKLFEANAELYEVMEDFSSSDTQGAVFFYNHVEKIYGLFSSLTEVQIDQFKQWCQGNNDLEKICANDPSIQVVRYSDIAIHHKDIAEQLAVFFKGLYSQSLLDLAVLRAKIGDIHDHYQSFAAVNKAGKCPFCGIGDIKGGNHSKREAYDHYLPKALYPFNSINFHNLAPACHECNSTYKLSKDPIQSGALRRKAFNPFASVDHVIQLQITLQHANIDALEPADIIIQFGPDTLEEELETWKDLYGIEERYKAKVCAENDGKYWLTQVLDEWKEEGLSPTEFMRTLARQAKKKPYAECNFLKEPFLKACHRIGVF
ncbi:TPA: HNH endonuclease [Klebsiella pneumoniae]